MLTFCSVVFFNHAWERSGLQISGDFRRTVYDDNINACRRVELKKWFHDFTRVRMSVSCHSSTWVGYQTDEEKYMIIVLNREASLFTSRFKGRNLRVKMAE